MRRTKGRMDRSDYLPSARLQELAHAIDPKLKLEPEAEQVLQDVADDFVENLAAFACELAVHRAGTTLEAKDIQLALEKQWNLRLVGVGDSLGELKVIKKVTVTEAHKGRVNDVRRSKLQQR